MFLGSKEIRGIFINVKLYFDDVQETNFRYIPFDYHETVAGDHGRIETGHYWTVSDIDWPYGRENWKVFKIIRMAESERDVEDKVSKVMPAFLPTL